VPCVLQNVFVEVAWLVHLRAIKIVIGLFIVLVDSQVEVIHGRDVLAELLGLLVQGAVF